MTSGQESAEIVALQALGWLVGNEEVLPAFLAATGVAPDDLRHRAGEAAFQIALLDFLMMEDAWVIAFCDQAGLPYEAVDQARQRLPGGARIHWT